MLIIAEHPQFGKVRTIENEGRMWFCAADVAQALGYVNTNDAIARHCKTKGVVFYDIPTAGGRQKVKFIDEGNLYRLIAGSRLPSAERFESWIFDELVPRTLKEGGYLLGKKGETSPSSGKEIGKASLPRVLPLPLEVLQRRCTLPIPCRRGREQPVEVQEIRQAVGVLLPVLRTVHGRPTQIFPAFHPLPVVYLRRCRGGQQHLADDFRKTLLETVRPPRAVIPRHRSGQQTIHGPFCAGHRRHKPE
jgi:hypothetical protein